MTAATPRDRLPSLFLPHGAGPCFFVDWNPPDAWDRLASYLKGLAASLPARPRAILAVSAHWLEPVFTTASAGQPRLIFDYHGFPPHTYRLTWPAPKDPALASGVVALLQEAGLAARGSGTRPRPRRLRAPEAGLPRGRPAAHGGGRCRRDFSDRVMEVTLSAFRFG